MSSYAQSIFIYGVLVFFVCLFVSKKKHQNGRTDIAQIFVGPRVTQGRVIMDDQIFKPNLT